MQIELLKKLYCEERKKLEAMPVYQKESRLQFIRMKKSILEKIGERLTLSEIEGRSDISEETKDAIFRDNEKRMRFENQVKKNIDEELDAVIEEEEEESRGIQYNPQEFAEYLFQLEKVAALENAIVEAQSYPGTVSENIYEEAEEKSRNEKGEGR